MDFIHREQPAPSENQAINTQAFCLGRESGSLLSEFSNKRHVLSRLEKYMAFSMNAIFGQLGLKELVSLHLRKDLLSNLATIICEKVEKFKKHKTILV